MLAWEPPTSVIRSVTRRSPAWSANRICIRVGSAKPRNNLAASWVEASAETIVTSRY